jgi:hypothetical protein
MKQKLAGPSKKLSTLVYLGVLVGFFAVMLIGIVLIGGQPSQRTESEASTPAALSTETFSLQIVAGEGLDVSEASSDPELEANVGQFVPTTDYTVPFAAGTSEGKLLELLEAFDTETSLFTLTTKEFSFGKMIVGINAVEADENSEFWEIVINGQQAQLGASELVIKAGDEVKLSLKEF